MAAVCFQMLVLATVFYNTPAMQILRTFRDPGGNKFQQMAIHGKTGDIFVGATNRLHKLSSELSLVQSASTGPREDNPDCPPPVVPCPEDIEKRLINSQTKGIVIDAKQNSLIVCSSLFHGHCQKVSTKNITNIEKFVQRPMVPNDDSSCVVFIGKGINAEPALYIAATYTSYGQKAYRDMVPSISSRKLSDLEFSYRDSIGATRKSVLEKFRKSFKIRYVDGFTHDNFVYFLSLQRKNPGSNTYVSKISRICQNDTYFYSYVELSLLCEDSVAEKYSIVRNAHVYNGKMFAVFSRSIPTSYQPPSASALCVFKMEDIDHVFNKTVQDCYDGSGTIGPEHFVQKHTCVATSAPVDECGHSDVAEAYSSIEGSRPVISSPVLVMDQKAATVVIARQEEQFDIIYIGTGSGTVIKGLIKPDSVEIVDSVKIDIRGSIRQIGQAKDPEKLVLLTSSKVTLISTRHCESRPTCETCVANSDPMCGWCVMQNRCTTQDQCGSSAINPHWLPATDQTCAKITNIKPEVFSYESLQNDQASKEITFELEKVALQQQNSLDLKCLFVAGTAKHGTQASVQNNKITCPLPESHRLPQIPQDHQDLVLQFHVQGKSIVTRSVSVFDCRVHQNCTSCTSSTFQCQWCDTTNTCIKDSSPCGQGGNTQPSSGITAVNSCPRIEMWTTDTDILVHSGEKKQIAVKVRNLQHDQKKNVNCHFSYLGESKIAPGTISASDLTCDPVEFSFADQERPYVTAAFQVTAGDQGFPLDNPKAIKVRIYKCPLMVTNCGKCLSMDAEYECGWCGNKCMLQKHCQETWLDRLATCPEPQILRFNPTTGPVMGKTNVSVTGINLGKSYTDITGNVTVAGIRCSLHPDHYQPSSGFKCETDQTPTVKSGTINVVVDGKYSAQSDSPFYFVNPLVKGLSPKKGPRSGGTTILIAGIYLNTGSSTTVMLGGAPCEVTRANKTALECRTSKHVANTDDVEVEVNFGGHKKLVPDTFTYIEDPTISMIEPKRSILSGGTTITVMGKGLDLIQNPEFFTTYGGSFFKSKCHLENRFELQCPVPQVNPGINVTETSPLEVHYGFNMDGVMTLKNISHESVFGPLLYYPNPIIYPFPGESRTKKYVKDDYLAVTGQFRSISPLMSNVVVYVGNDMCAAPAATDTAITCKPPPSPGGIDNTGKAVVELQIGNLKTDVGYLQYYEVSKSDKPIALGVILGVVLPIIAIIILLTICVIRRHRKHRPSENYIPDVLKDYEGKKEDEEMGMNHVSVKADMNGQMTEDRDSGPYIADLLGKFEDTALRTNISSMLIPRSRLDIGELIGKGQFGAVYKAQYQRNNDEKPVQIAVKTLQAKNTEAEAMQSFLQDTVMLKDLQNAHILSVVGVCITASDDPLVIMPFMATEDLKNYIREPSKNITVLELLDFAKQIAEGMVYLEEVKIVHRNLAARNCIVTEDKTVRLTDYGITKSLFPKEYYFSDDSNAKLLLKWMAPETLEQFEFSSKSDVWAFGVVTWELLTRGVTPYPDVESADLASYLKNGKRMKKPRQCTENVYQLMLKCWGQTTSERPTFQEALDELKTFIQSDEGVDNESESQPLMSSVDIGGSTEYLEVIG